MISPDQNKSGGYEKGAEAIPLATGLCLWPFKRYTEMYRRSLEDPERFWAEQARQLDWYKTWDRVLDWEPPYARWFVGFKDAAVSHPAVAEAAVVGKPDPVKGEAIVLFVTLKEGAIPSDELRKEISRHLRESVGPVATPEEIYFTHSLPKTRSGKIMRRLLKAIALGQELGDVTTLEDEASVEEVRKAFESFKQDLGRENE